MQIKQVLESDGGACLNKYNTKASGVQTDALYENICARTRSQDDPNADHSFADCQYVIRGVSGGPVRHPVETTNREKTEAGEDQVCVVLAL